MNIGDSITYDGKVGVITLIINSVTPYGVTFNDQTKGWFKAYELVRGVPLLEATGCKFPLWEFNDVNRNVCNNTRWKRYAYCREHSKKCYLKESENANERKIDTRGSRITSETQHRYGRIK